MSILKNCTEAGKKAIIDAVIENMGYSESVYPTSMNEAEYRAFKQSEIEHAPNLAVRMNPVTFKVEYYNEITGEVVSSHI